MHHRIARCLALLLLPILSGCGEVESPPSDDTVVESDAPEEITAFMGARLFDGTGSPVVEDGVVLVRDGIIAAVGTRADVPVPDGAERVDLSGTFLMPGLINAHGHVGAGGDRSDVGEQLEIYAHYGVTTVQSLGDEADDRREERWSADLERARLFVSGPSLNPGSPEEARSEVERVREMGADWVKMHVNAARGREFFTAVIEAAHEVGLPAAIHIEELEDARNVLDAGADLLAHSVRDEPVDDDLMERMRDTEVCLTPTFTRELSTYVYADRPAFFDDPFFLERAAPDDLDDFLTPQRQAQAESESARYWRDALPLAKANMMRLHEEGAGIAMGTDSGPSGRFQGYFEHLELEMMVEAGMTPTDALVSATGGAARCLGLAGRVGTLEAGVHADFLVLDGDPTVDILQTRAIHGVWIAGNRIR